MQHLIVSRHPAAIEFIRNELPEFSDAPVLASASADDVRGADVAGNLPLDLAAEARVVRAIVYPAGRAPRGSEYTLEDMYEAGAAIKAFYVFAAQQ